MLDKSIKKSIILPAKSNKKAFDNLFKDFYPKLTAYACLFLETQAAEDVVQDVFIYIWENSEIISIHTSIEAYLFKAVYLRCLNKIKQRKIHTSHHNIIKDYLLEFEIRLFDPDVNESVWKLFMKELKNEIKAAINTLPEKSREVFMLSYIYNFKNKEISELLGITLSTVENHCYSALKKLRIKLKKHAFLIIFSFSLSLPLF